MYMTFPECTQAPQSQLWQAIALYGIRGNRLWLDVSMYIHYSILDFVEYWAKTATGIAVTLKCENRDSTVSSVLILQPRRACKAINNPECNNPVMMY